MQVGGRDVNFKRGASREVCGRGGIWSQQLVPIPDMVEDSQILSHFFKAYNTVSTLYNALSDTGKELYRRLRIGIPDGV